MHFGNIRSIRCSHHDSGLGPGVSPSAGLGICPGVGPGVGPELSPSDTFQVQTQEHLRRQGDKGNEVAC